MLVLVLVFVLVLVLVLVLVCVCVCVCLRVCLRSCVRVRVHVCWCGCFRSFVRFCVGFWPFFLPEWPAESTNLHKTTPKALLCENHFSYTPFWVSPTIASSNVISQSGSSAITTESPIVGVPKHGRFEAGGLQFLPGGSLLRSFALLCVLLFALFCALVCTHLPSFCVRLRLEQPRLGNFRL